MKSLTVVIPNKTGQDPSLTINSLYRQSFTDFDIIIINDLEGNANIARNEGLAMVKTPFVLFSDNDIDWLPNALSQMMDCMQNPDIAYSWGSYMLADQRIGHSHWDYKLLLKRNYISTMAIVRTHLHPGFDPEIKRLQDWDVWLTMLFKGLVGQFTGTTTFHTPLREGITTNSIPISEAMRVIKEKHGL